MTIRFLEPANIKQYQETINNDPEFKIASNCMTQDMVLGVGTQQCLIKINEGVVTTININPTPMDSWSFRLSGPIESWEKLLQPVPPPFYDGLFAGMMRGTFQIEGNLEIAFGYVWAVSRILDILRDLQNREYLPISA